MERVLQREHRQRGTGKAGRALGSSLLPGQLAREMRAMAGDESYGFQRVILHRVETTLRESFSFSLPGSPEAFFPQLLCIQEGHMPTSGRSDVDAIDINHFHPWPTIHPAQCHPHLVEEERYPQDGERISECGASDDNLNVNAKQRWSERGSKFSVHITGLFPLLGTCCWLGWGDRGRNVCYYDHSRASSFLAHYPSGLNE